MDKVANKYFGEEGGQSVATSDGNIMGNFGGKILAGTWEWSDNYFCRSSTIGEFDLGHHCLQIEVTNSKMCLTLNKGQGISVSYDKK